MPLDSEETEEEGAFLAAGAADAIAAAEAAGDFWSFWKWNGYIF